MRLLNNHISLAGPEKVGQFVVKLVKDAHFRGKLLESFEDDSPNICMN